VMYLPSYQRLVTVMVPACHSVTHLTWPQQQGLVQFEDYAAKSLCLVRFFRQGSVPLLCSVSLLSWLGAVVTEAVAEYPGWVWGWLTFEILRFMRFALEV
jgi:hypothetical protein